MRRTITAGLLLMLAGFAPPDRPPASLEPTQQQAIPKSWVPEKKPDQAPPITLDVTPRAPSAYTHGRDLVCEPVSGPRGVPKEFVDAYQAARVAIQNNQFAEALRQVELAAPYARDAREWIVIEQMRLLCFHELGNDLEIVASLEVLLASKNCVGGPQVKNYRNLLDEARARLGVPR